MASDDEKKADRNARLTRLFDETLGDLRPQLRVIGKTGESPKNLTITNWESAITKIPETIDEEIKVPLPPSKKVKGNVTITNESYWIDIKPVGFTQADMDPALDKNSFRIEMADPSFDGSVQDSITVRFRVKAPDGSELENVAIKLKWNDTKKSYESADLVLVSSSIEDNLKTETLPEDNSYRDQTFLAVPGATVSIDYEGQSYSIGSVPVQCRTVVQPFILPGGKLKSQDDISAHHDKQFTFSKEVFAQAGVVVEQQAGPRDVTQIPGLNLKDGKFDSKDHYALVKYLKKNPPPQGTVPIFYADVEKINVSKKIVPSSYSTYGYYFPNRGQTTDFIVVSTHAPLNAVAHEMGHKLGLTDFSFHDNLENPEATEHFRQTNVMAYGVEIKSETGERIIPDSKRYLSNDQINTIHNNMNCKEQVAPEQTPAISPQENSGSLVPELQEQAPRLRIL